MCTCWDVHLLHPFHSVMHRPGELEYTRGLRHNRHNPHRPHIDHDKDMIVFLLALQKVVPTKKYVNSLVPVVQSCKV